VSRILVWSPNYAPEPTGIPPLVTDAAEWLAQARHDVDVATAVPNYPERSIHVGYRGVLFCTEMRNGVRVHRSWLRARPEHSFADKALYELTISTFALPNAVRLARRSDVIVCVIPTLMAARYAATLARALNKRLVIWVQDLVLAAAESVGIGPTARRALSAARRVERAVVRAADTVVVCSSGFRDYLIRSGADPEKIETIHNWADVDWIKATQPSANGHPTRFLYAGNLGYTQGFETLIDAARLGGDRFSVEIVGAGNAAADVRRLADPRPNVFVREPVGRADYPGLLASADAHVVLQRRISAGANLPSKIATYMASGRPIIASIDGETPAADLLRKSGGAILVEPESPQALARAMGELGRDPVRRSELGRRGREFAERHLAKEPALGRLEAAILG
jgi:colanic acid biosynthesis glycosyl transferase WcaI